ncbi:hypothetical protein Hanom_Chr00s024667g01763771 [Helianthus anomalus]
MSRWSQVSGQDPSQVNKLGLVNFGFVSGRSTNVNNRSVQLWVSRNELTRSTKSTRSTRSNRVNSVDSVNSVKQLDISA